MNLTNKEILTKANAFVTAGDHESFLAHCTDGVVWDFVGDKKLQGKDAVRQYMKETYIEPPQFDVEHLFAEGNFVTAVGTISLKDNGGKTTTYSYCDIWRFRNDKLAELKAFVIEIKAN